MRLIIAGTRFFKDYKLLKEKVDFFLKNVNEPIELVCGGAPGADTLGADYGRERGYQIKLFLPEWQWHGKAAGPIRNKQMAEYAAHCIVFWDGKSPGTKNMIDLCKEYKVPLRVVMYK